MNDWTIKTLKKYLRAKINSNDKLYKEKFANQAEALKLQAKEYERRLEVLNHAHEQAVEVQHTYVTQVKYEDFIKEYDRWKAETSQITSLTINKSTWLSSGWGYLLGAIVLISTLIDIYIKLK